MPRRCSICDHPSRLRIDHSLLRQPYRTVAEQFGVSASAAHRHRTEHLPLRLLSAAADAEEASAQQVLTDLQGLKTIAVTILKRAMSSGDLPLALKAVGEVRSLLGTTLRAVETTEMESRLTALESTLQQRKLSAG